MPAPRSLLKPFEKWATTETPNPPKRKVVFDSATTGLAVLISPKGKKTYTVVARDPHGKQIWKEIGDPAVINIEDARKKARIGVARIKAGETSVFPEERPPAPVRTFAAMRDEFLKRHVRKEGQKDSEGKPIPPLRSGHEIHRIFCGAEYAKWITGDRAGEAPAIKSLYIPKDWNDRPFIDIERVDITEILDKIEDERGATQASAVLAQISSLCEWYAARDGKYSSPVVRRMKRTKMSERARKRFLSDDEIRTLWAACDKHGTYGAIIRTCLLTAQRREKVVTMKWDDIKDNHTMEGFDKPQDGVWVIPGEVREKNDGGSLKLPKMVLDIINAQPQIEGNPHVFAGRGKLAFNSFSQRKVEMEKDAPIARWVLHDLRRTARTLMSRARVRPDYAERTLGHIIKLTGTQDTYDRHEFAKEKSEALEALAALVERIVDPPADNVVSLKAEA